MPELANTTARIRRRSSLVGTGCVIQLIGIIAGAILFFTIPIIGWVLGPLITLSLLAYGGRQAITYECSNCNNPVASKRVLICPACQASFGR